MTARYTVRRLVPLLLFFSFTIGSIAGQTIVRTLFLPQVFYPGDIVEARVTVRGIDPDQLVVPSALPDLEWINIRDVSFVGTGDGVGVRIVFQPFYVGTRNLPALDLGAFALDSVTAVVSSTVGQENRQIEPMRSQLLLPGTQLLAGLVIVLVLVIPIVVYLTWGYGRKQINALIRRYRSGLPYRRLNRGLRQLQAEIHEIDARRFYIRLTELARTYLARRASNHFISATTGELPVYLDQLGLSEEAYESLLGLFRAGDLAKFASQHISLDQRKSHAEALHGVAKSIQRTYRDSGQTANTGRRRRRVDT